MNDKGRAEHVGDWIEEKYGEKTNEYEEDHKSIGVEAGTRCLGLNHLAILCDSNPVLFITNT